MADTAGRLTKAGQENARRMCEELSPAKMGEGYGA
jgi:hypothetical protein